MQEYEELYNIAQELNTTQHSVDTESAVAAAYQLKRLIENPYEKRPWISWRLIWKQYERMTAGKSTATFNRSIKEICDKAKENALRLAKRIYVEEVYAKSVVDAEMLTIKLYAAVEAFTNYVRDQIYELEKENTDTSGGNIRNSLAHLRERFAGYPELFKKLKYITDYMLPAKEELADLEKMLDMQYSENQINSTLQYCNRKNKICKEGRDTLRMLLLQIESAETEKCEALLDDAVYYLQGRNNQLSYLERLLSDCLDGDMQLQEIEYPEMIYYGTEVARKVEPLLGKPEAMSDIHPIEDVRIVKGKHIDRDLISGKRQTSDTEYGEDYIREYHQKLYREGIGIDYTQLSFDVKSVDTELLERAIVSRQKPKDPKMLIDTWIECMSSNDSNYTPIFSEVDGIDRSFIQRYSWKMVKIQLSPYAILKFKQNNIKANKYDSEKKTDYLMEIKVVPRIWQLGNWENYTVDEYSEKVNNAVQMVKEIFGIYIDEDSVMFQTIEINNTFAFGHTMNELIRPLKYYQLYLDNFYNSVYEVGRGGNMLTAAKENQVSIKELSHRKREGMSVTGLYSVLKNSKNMAIKIYDKAMETQDTFHAYNERNEIDIMEPEGSGSYIRAEFRLKKTQKIYEHFIQGVNSGHTRSILSACPVEITQEELIRIYQCMIEIYFEEPFKEYCRESTIKLERLIESVNPEDPDWRDTFKDNVRDEEIAMRSTPMILQASDIDDAIRRSKFSRRASRIIPIFHKMLKDSKEYPLGREKSYEMLSQFIHTAKMEEGISKEREVAFYTLRRRE